MNKFQRTILIVIIILVILLLAILITFLSIRIKTQEAEEEQLENTYQPIDEIQADEEVKLVSSHNQYYSILECINQYYTGIQERNSQKVYQLLDSNYIQEKALDINNVLNNIANNGKTEYHVNEMYIQEAKNMSAYYVSGYLENEDAFFTVYLDQYNATYAILPISSDQYNQLIKRGENLEAKTISANESNQYKVITVNDGTITARLLEDYQYRIRRNLQESYQQLDKEYREKKFTNIEEYSQYIEQSGIQNVKLVKYQKAEGENYTQYIGLDENNKYYIFQEKAAMNYSVILDTYTIDLPEFVEKYNDALEEQKVGLNIQRMFDAINDGDYGYVYNKLDNTFKSNNFKTEAQFEAYIKEHFFTNNELQHNTCKKNGNLYMYEVTVIDKDNKNKQINKTFIMQLKEGTDFVFSFNI